MSMIVMAVLFLLVDFQCHVHIILVMTVSWDAWLVTTVFLYLMFIEVLVIFKDKVSIIYYDVSGFVVVEVLYIEIQGLP